MVWKQTIGQNFTNGNYIFFDFPNKVLVIIPGEENRISVIPPVINMIYVIFFQKHFFLLSV